MYRWEKVKEKGEELPKELPIIQLCIDDLTEQEIAEMGLKKGELELLGINYPNGVLRIGYTVPPKETDLGYGALDMFDLGYGALHMFIKEDGELKRYQLNFQNNGAEKFFEYVSVAGGHGVEQDDITHGSEPSKKLSKIAIEVLRHIPEVLLKEGNFQGKEFYLERIPDRSP